MTEKVLKLNTAANSLKILHIAGAGRSGSTILEKVLAQVEGIAALGEVTYLWQRGFLNGQSCSCGKSFNSCEVWRSIVHNAFPNGIDIDTDLNELLAATSSVGRFRHLPLYMAKPRLQKFQTHVDFLADNLLKVYRGAASAHNALLLIDSSKHMHGHVLSSMKEIDLYVLHLVRDGRATVHSWSRPKIYEKHQDKTIDMPKIHPFFASLSWVLDNISAEFLSRKCHHYMRIRYEDFTRDPRKVLDTILTFIGFPISSNPISLDSSLDLKIQHTVSGNPVRFRTGLTHIVADESWLSQMPKRNRLLASLLTLPLLLRYGYFSKHRVSC